MKNFFRLISRQLLITRSWFRFIIRCIWIFVLLAVIGLPIYIYGVYYNPFNLFGPMPALREIENPENDLSSEVISSDGVSLGRYARFDRSAVTYDKL